MVDPSSTIQIDPNDSRPAEIEKSSDDEEGGFVLLKSYYDIAIVGRTGLGKSSLGNKVLQAKPRNTNDLNERKSDRDSNPGEIMLCDKYSKGVATNCRPDLRFATADDSDILNDQKIHSITKCCKLIGNEKTKVRVLDTAGFFPSPLHESMTMDQANLQVFRWIVREQLDKNNRMQIKRLLYFFPERGIPRNADGALQRELSIMYKFFGTAVFSHMVVIATQSYEYQSFSFKNEHCEKVQKIFMEVVKMATRGELPDCRAPVVYIGLDDDPDDILKKIQEAPVRGDPNSSFIPAFQDNLCSRCNGEIRYSKPSSGNVVPVGVLRSDDEFEKYEVSKCHPCFIRRYSNAEKIVGGIGHVATLGIPYVVTTALDMVSWPGFFNTDEMCAHCKRLPGSVGCCQVEEQVEIDGLPVTVYHTNQL